MATSFDAASPRWPGRSAHQRESPLRARARPCRRRRAAWWLWVKSRAIWPSTRPSHWGHRAHLDPAHRRDDRPVRRRQAAPWVHDRSAGGPRDHL